MTYRILMSMRFYGEPTEENYIEFEKVILKAVEEHGMCHAAAEDILMKARDLLGEGEND